MKRIAVLGILSAVLLIAVAAIGPTSAQATAFCEVNEDPCEAEDTLGVPVEFELSLKEGSEAILSNGLEISCTTSSAKGEMSEESEEAEKLIGTISELSFGGCSSSCTITAQNLPYKVELDATGSGDGTLEITSGGSGNPRAKANCFGLECLYGTSKAQLNADGGTPALFEADKVTLNKEGGSILCGSKVEWDADYELNEFESMFFVEAGQTTTLCEAEPTKEEVGKVKFLKCPKGKKYAGIVQGSVKVTSFNTFSAVGEAGRYITCSSSTLTGKFNTNGTSVDGEGITAWTFDNGSGGPCTSELNKNKPTVTVTVKDLNYDSSRLVYLRWFANEGTAVLEKVGGGLPKLEMSFEKTTCSYGLKSLGSEYVNDEVPHGTMLNLFTTWTLTGWVGPGCPGEMTNLNQQSLSRPGGGKVYVAEK